MKPLVEITNLVKYFNIGSNQRVHAVDDVSFSIYPKEVVGLVGESGSGKSTLGKTLLGLHDKTAAASPLRANSYPSGIRPRTFVPWHQNADDFSGPVFVVESPHDRGRNHRGRSPPAARTEHQRRARARVAVVILVGLSPVHQSRYPHEFSGGQRQRIGIARALILQPESVVCDEPISALDVSVQAQVVNLLGELAQDQGLTLLFIAHDLSMVRYISDRMAVMYLGALVEVGSSSEVFFDPKHPYTETLIASNPEADPEHERRRLFNDHTQGEIPSPVMCPRAVALPTAALRPWRIAEASPQLKPVSSEPQAAKTPRLVACHLYD